MKRKTIKTSRDKKENFKNHGIPSRTFSKPETMTDALRLYKCFIFSNNDTPPYKRGS